jgi:hypothetical protein
MQYPEIDVDIPYAEYPPTFADLADRVQAAFNSLAEISDEIQVTDDDAVVARQVMSGVSRATNVLLSSPGTVVQIKAILDEYDREVVQSAKQIRNYVTNKLILDSTNPDPRVRLKCYEMLGKISDVGLFTDKTEVTMRHRPTEELEQLLRERLMKTIDEVPDPVAIDPVTLDAVPQKVEVPDIKISDATDSV